MTKTAQADRSNPTRTLKPGGTANPAATSGLVSMADVAAIRRALRAEGRSIVVTNGCFDLLHVGHLRYLQSARALGELLWVGINSDDAVRILKGENRPIHPDDERAELLLALRCVDLVTIFPDVRATDFLRAVEPTIYVKGGDYTPETLDPGERGALEEVKAEIRILQLIPGRSTSAALKKLGEAKP